MIRRPIFRIFWLVQGCKKWGSLTMVIALNMSTVGLHCFAGHPHKQVVPVPKALSSEEEGLYRVIPSPHICYLLVGIEFRYVVVSHWWLAVEVFLSSSCLLVWFKGGKRRFCLFWSHSHGSWEALAEPWIWRFLSAIHWVKRFRRSAIRYHLLTTYRLICKGKAEPQSLAFDGLKEKLGTEGQWPQRYQSSSMACRYRTS